MRTLLTGAAGFIGSHVSESLLALGHEIMAIDNLNDYYDPAQKRRNILDIETNAAAPGRFTFVRGDVRDQQLIADLCVQHHIDTVVHLAAMAGVRASVDSPDLYVDVNVRGTLAVLNAAHIAGVDRVVLASTS